MFILPNVDKSSVAYPDVLIHAEHPHSLSGIPSTHFLGQALAAEELWKAELQQLEVGPAFLFLCYSCCHMLPYCYENA